MITKDKKDSAGKVLYCEFRKGSSTYQLLVTPPAIGLDNQPAKATIIRRKVSVWHPRRNWNVDYSSALPNDRDSYGEFSKLDSYAVKTISSSVLEGFYGSQFSNLVNQEWELYKKPLVAEFTYEELDTIQQSGKLPVSLYRRIERVRKNQGFAESLFHESVATV